ncbi:glycosyltransferase family 4 protein [Streptomyces griseoviridis]|uniref:glycosyltransferase family 4 protein n=1 Tax=Streptomyces griseoviridis TaxID=45398 RepID=UPI0033E830F9
MKIAMVAPPYLPCPPKGYGGVERVIATLTDALAAAGHDVTLFGHPASEVRGRVVTPDVEQTEVFDFQRDALHASVAMRDLGQFDIVHNHSVALLLFRQWLTTPMVTTVHGTTHYDAVRPIYREHKDAHYVSISNRQRSSGLLDMNWTATVYNGVDTEFFVPARRREADAGYLLHIGTLCQRKGTAEAVRIALRTGRQMIVAGRIDPINQKYFDEQVAPYVDGDQIQFVGEVDGLDKVRLYQNASALVLPLNWHEPFGLVMAEAGACGVPVLVTDMGSAREVVVPGRTGFIAPDADTLADQVARIDEIDPEDCLAHVRARFGSQAMIDGYCAVYEKLAGRG